MSDNAGLSTRQEEITSTQLTSQVWKVFFTLYSINYIPYRFSNDMRGEKKYKREILKKEKNNAIVIQQLVSACRHVCSC